MPQTTKSRITGRPLIESDRVEGTMVYDPRGNKIGSIKRLMIEKISGLVAYAVRMNEPWTLETIRKARERAEMCRAETELASGARQKELVESHSLTNG
jgi:hypothetical protein